MEKLGTSAVEQAATSLRLSRRIKIGIFGRNVTPSIIHKCGGEFTFRVSVPQPAGSPASPTFIGPCHRGSKLVAVQASPASSALEAAGDEPTAPASSALEAASNKPAGPQDPASVVERAQAHPPAKPAVTSAASSLPPTPTPASPLMEAVTPCLTADAAPRRPPANLGKEAAQEAEEEDAAPDARSVCAGHREGEVRPPPGDGTHACGDTSAEVQTLAGQGPGAGTQEPRSSDAEVATPAGQAPGDGTQESRRSDAEAQTAAGARCTATLGTSTPSGDTEFPAEPVAASRAQELLTQLCVSIVPVVERLQRDPDLEDIQELIQETGALGDSLDELFGAASAGADLGNWRAFEACIRFFTTLNGHLLSTLEQDYKSAKQKRETLESRRAMLADVLQELDGKQGPRDHLEDQPGEVRAPADVPGGRLEKIRDCMSLVRQRQEALERHVSPVC